MSSKYDIPNKIPSYIRRLEIMYRDSKESILHQIICSASVYVREGISYDNWNGGTTGHAIKLFLEEGALQRIGNFETQKRICETFENDFRECASAIPREFIQNVYIELYDENDPDSRLSVKPFNQPIINPDLLSFWKPGHIRLFISHRDEYKKKASELGVCLENYGVSSFIAHDTIEPMEKWQHVVQTALQSAEIVLAFITNDFFDSEWTNQEIGVALGRGTPIIPLKLQQTAPRGFISDTQALIGNFDMPQNSADGIYKVLSEKLGQEERLRKALVQAFVTSPDFNETQSRFERLKTLPTLTEADIRQIIEGFSSNNQLYNCGYLNNQYHRLTTFLENRTGKKYQINNGSIKQVQEQSPDAEVNV